MIEMTDDQALQWEIASQRGPDKSEADVARQLLGVLGFLREPVDEHKGWTDNLRPPPVETREFYRYTDGPVFGGASILAILDPSPRVTAPLRLSIETDDSGLESFQDVRIHVEGLEAAANTCRDFALTLQTADIRTDSPFLIHRGGFLSVRAVKPVMKEGVPYHNIPAPRRQFVLSMSSEPVTFDLEVREEHGYKRVLTLNINEMVPLARGLYNAYDYQRTDYRRDLAQQVEDLEEKLKDARMALAEAEDYEL